MAKPQNWIPEKLAAQKLNVHPRTLRRLAKEGTKNVAFRTLNNRNYQYEEATLDNLFDIKKAVRL